MSGIAFEWNRVKEVANRRKHGVEFREASTVFRDALSITIDDPDHGGLEDRLIIVGRSDRGRLLVVVHTVREERIRLISARPATNHERRTYEDNSF